MNLSESFCRFVKVLANDFKAERLVSMRESEGGIMLLNLSFETKHAGEVIGGLEFVAKSELPVLAKDTCVSESRGRWAFLSGFFREFSAESMARPWSASQASSLRRTSSRDMFSNSSYRLSIREVMS